MIARPPAAGRFAVIPRGPTGHVAAYLFFRGTFWDILGHRVRTRTNGDGAHVATSLARPSILQCGLGGSLKLAKKVDSGLRAKSPRAIAGCSHRVARWTMFPIHPTPNA